MLFVLLRCWGRVMPRPLLWRIVVLCLSLGALLCSLVVLPMARVMSFLVPCLWAPPFSWTPCVVPHSCACVVALCAVVSRPPSAGWCCLLLPVVFGCLLLGVAVLCCLLVASGVVFQWCCPCLPAWLAALWFDVVCIGGPLPSVALCGAVLSCVGVLSSLLFVCVVPCVCCLFPAAAPSGVCVVGCRAVCSLCSPLCALLCCAVLVALRCAVREVYAISGAWC